MLRPFFLLLAVRASIPNKGIVNLISYKIKATLPRLKLILLIELLFLVVRAFIIRRAFISSGVSILNSKSFYSFLLLLILFLVLL